MKTYRMNIAGLDRDLPICPLNDTLSIGAFVIFGDPELTTAAAEALFTADAPPERFDTPSATPEGKETEDEGDDHTDHVPGDD